MVKRLGFKKTVYVLSVIQIVAVISKNPPQALHR